MKYFTISELCASPLARQRRIDNIPDEETVERLTVLIDKLLDPLRELCGAPIRINSGYRCEELNRAVGGAKNSQHLTGEAADITAGSVSKNRRLFQKIIDSGLEFDQMIDENNCQWIHISYSSDHNRKQQLKLKNL